MRTIKFRGKRIDNGEWVFGFLTAYLRTRENENEYFIQDDSCDRFLHRVDPETVGQFVDMKDDADVEIFEGDLLEIDGGAKPFIVEVFFEHGQFRAKVPWLDKSEEQPPVRAYVGVVFAEASVIGNIFETREDG